MSRELIHSHCHLKSCSDKCYYKGNNQQNYECLPEQLEPDIKCHFKAFIPELSKHSDETSYGPDEEPDAETSHCDEG